MMNIVFVNSFEKRDAEDNVLTAQVSISEREGVWQAQWSEPGSDGQTAHEQWFQGVGWHEMMTVFRTKLAEKASSGFLPLVDDMYDMETPSGRTKYGQMLHYYSEVNGNDELFQKLRHWRREQAVKEGKPSYIVATNRVLRMISCFRPHTNQELMCIPGFGEHKCSLYGTEITGLTREYERSSLFPLDWVARRVDTYQFRLWQHKQKELKLKAELERKAARQRLLQLVSEGQPLEHIVQVMQMQRREVIMAIEELETDGYDVDAFIDSRLQSVPERDQELAWKMFEAEGDRYLKPIVQKLYDEEELKTKDVDHVYEWVRLLRIRFRKERGAEMLAG